MGEQFIVATWPGCSEDDPRFHQLVDKLKHEVAPPPKLASHAGDSLADDLTTIPFDRLTPDQRAALDRARARDIGDDLGLGVVPDDYEDWGGLGERWLQGDKGVWYYITPDGELFRWKGRNNLVGYLNRTFRRSVLGERAADGELVAKLGQPGSEENANEFHADPQKLTARLFKSITTGPDTLHLLADKDGPLWPRGIDDEHASQEAQALALQRLTGTLFGPDAKQTCIVLTLSEPGKRDLRRVIGRPLLGRPKGRLLQLATDECGIALEDLKLGGPPVDNVAIDEEGQITLARLVGYSALVGIVLALVCFRSPKITTMIFFVGGVSAISSLGIVWWTGGSVDAIVMSMPSLIYVLGLSGAVHIVNYYRDAVEEHGLEGAPERAVLHGWKPCTLAAFTTALGLLSLNTSNIVPIRNFGFYSAIGVMATLILLFTYLPSALEIWPPRYQPRKNAADNPLDMQKRLIAFWEPIGRWIVGHWAVVGASCIAVFIVGALGLPKLNTSIELLKLFDGDAKIIRDYTWLEDNLGELVPMELVVRVAPELLRTPSEDIDQAEPDSEDLYRLSFLERMEIASRVQDVVEKEFGHGGQGIVGRGMSVPTLAPELPAPAMYNPRFPERSVMNSQLEQHRHEYLGTDYLRIDREPPHKGSELWRVSIRLGALNGVDYGQFVHQLKRAVDPVMTAYRYRDRLLHEVADQRGEAGFVRARVAFLGMPEPGPESDPATAETDRQDTIDQTAIFADTLADALTNASVYSRAGCWHDPDQLETSAGHYTSEDWGRMLERYDAVVLMKDHDAYDLDFIQQHAKLFVDARDHQYVPDSAAKSAAELGDPIHVVYTGVVPIVYKAQRTLLTSLIDSIGWAFVMIALVMMFLLRSGPFTLGNLLNFRGGLLSMVPNVFPVVLIFGSMGHMGMLVDIGTMMTASVAMGVAVDDTIHFLTWFRDGVNAGVPRHQAIIEAYKRCAAAMSQTTLIGGFGLAVFAFSTFTPTQCFGVMMLMLLAAALVGDLIFLPALLASPLGRYFCPRSPRGEGRGPDDGRCGSDGADQPNEASGFGAPHIGEPVAEGRQPRVTRQDRGHEPYKR